MKKILILAAILGILLGVGFYTYFHFFQKDIKKTDELVKIQNENKEFQNGYNELINGNTTGAIEHFEKSKENINSLSGIAIVDFNIASAKFEQDRNSGVASYADLAKDERYPKRTRALAMQRAYLMYRRFNDENLLRTLAEKNDIEWTNSEDVKHKYMQKSYDVYPLPGSSIFLLKKELSATSKKEDAEKILSRYKNPIEDGISAMKETSGELVEATSAMLGYANTLSLLYVKFSIGNKETVEKHYKDLIQFDQDKNFTTNKQYTLLYYADFLSSLGDYRGANEVLGILTSEPLDSALIEALPKSKEFTYLSKIPSEFIRNTDIVKIIAGIGSDTQK